MRLTRYKRKHYEHYSTGERKICWLENNIVGVNSKLRMWFRRLLN